MTRSLVPTYQFDFRGGVSKSNSVVRTCSLLNEGVPHHIYYRLDDLPLAGSLGHRLPASVADLVDVATAISISDRLALREPPNDLRPAHDRWHRQIHVVLPVRQPQSWRRPEITKCLTDLLAFLTDDTWTFVFTDRRHDPRQSEAQVSFLRQLVHPTAVVLSSGGLDSLIGQIDLLSASDVATVMPVTVVTNRRVHSVSQSVVGELRKAIVPTSVLLQSACIHIGIERNGRPRDDREPSHRARAMLFLAAGVGASVIAGSDRLYVCENGVGAVSLPMTADHWGARASKAMHPKTLALFANLASQVLDRPMTIQNLGLFSTKGELVRKLDRDRFAAAAQQTVSCDRASYRRKGTACGKCTSCLLRRVALNAEGLDVFVDGQAIRYETDWCDPAALWENGNAGHLVAMRYQVEQIRLAIEREPSFSRLEVTFPDLSDVVAQALYLELSKKDVERRLLRLYRTHVREFDAFVAKIDRPGWGRRGAITELIPAVKTPAAG